jgi:carboxyl-terminal processing protease
MARGSVRQATVFGFAADASGNQMDPWVDRDRGIAFLRIERFRSYTDEAVAERLGRLEGLQSVILDLRGNSGGDVQAAANVVDLFAVAGEVAQLDGPGAPAPPGPDEVAWNSLRPGSALEGLNVVVLVDRDTASAAEIAAGSLQHHVGAIVIGERTWGKGWSQGLRVVDPPGLALNITNASWTLPSGRGVQRAPGASAWGVEPSISIRVSAAEQWQWTRARQRAEFPRVHADGTPMRPPEVPTTDLPGLDADPLVVRALLALHQGG